MVFFTSLLYVVCISIVRNYNVFYIFLHVDTSLKYIVPRIPKDPLCRAINNPHARATHNYSVVEDLVQSHVVVSTIEVLQKCPTQQNSLSSSLGVVDLHDDYLITFDLDLVEPHLPSTMAFHVMVTIRIKLSIDVS